jgi:type VI secretion system secreted protein Hcp
MAAEQNGTSRREVLRGGALGVGALVGAAGASTAVSEAVAPRYRMAMATSGTQEFWLAVAGVDGPSTTKGFEKQIPLKSFGWGVTDTAVTGGSGGSGVGKTIGDNFTFSALSSKASPRLFLLCCQGTHIATITMRGLRISSSGAHGFMRLDLTEVIVAAVHTTEAGDGAAIDHVELNYRTAKYTVDGVVATFDFATTNP